MEFKCTCHNSGTNSFSGKCSNCGMTKPSQGVTISNNSEPYKTIHQNKSELEQFYKPSSNTNDVIANLDRYSECFERGFGVLKHEQGEYVLFSDVIEAVSFLFSAKTDLEKVTNLTLDIQSGLLRSVERLVKTIKDDKKLGKEIRERFGEI